MVLCKSSVLHVLIDANFQRHTVHQHSLDGHLYSRCLAGPTTEESEGRYDGEVQAN